ncbi:DUF3231 family protein [Oceanobacillus rekensis]|uniref:DUF3231 family protein n=1 Tax=Oceanobacillus rekensis TaxID=937927 RepID=UPI000B4506EE|nr:DUF3231 family protein [Oceanobacillus rekensis]
MGILSGNPENEPMHYGEVFATWSFLAAANGMVAGNQKHLNHAGDEDLQKLLEEAIQAGKQEIAQIETLLKDNGIGLPPSLPEPPKANLDEIPDGARFQDMEIAATLGTQNAAGLVACSQIIGESIREDIAMMFGQFHTQKAILGAKVLKLTKDKGWLIPPPLLKNKTEE